MTLRRESQGHQGVSVTRLQMSLTVVTCCAVVGDITHRLEFILASHYISAPEIGGIYHLKDT